MRILISAGPTREALDPVRFLTNHSSGKMGYALASAAIRAGHTVTLVSGPVALKPPEGLHEFVSIQSASDMAAAIKQHFPDSDLTIMCAAVADYRPVKQELSKIKKSEGHLILELERTEDILKTLGGLKRAGQILVGFAAETDHLAEYARGKMERKNLDWIAANLVGVPGRGFAADSNAVTLYARSGEIIELPLMEKERLAEQILSRILPSL